MIPGRGPRLQLPTIRPIWFAACALALCLFAGACCWTPKWIKDKPPIVRALWWIGPGH